MLVENYVLGALVDYIFLLVQIQLDPNISKELWLKILIRFLNITNVSIYVYLNADNRVLIERLQMRGTPYDKISHVNHRGDLFLDFVRF